MTWLWLKKAWEWCKINWKFILGISIPIIISILLRRGNSAKIYKKASESRRDQLDALNKVHELENSRKDDAQKEFLEAVDRITTDHEDALRRLAAAERETLNEIDTAEEATTAIRERLDK